MDLDGGAQNLPEKGSPYRWSPYTFSALDDKFLLQPKLANPLAKVALELDRAIPNGAAGAARALELLTQILQKRSVARQAVHHRDGLPTSPFLLHPQRCDEAVWD